MKKKITSFLLAAFIALTALTFTGCGEKDFDYESMIKINDRFSGTRTLTINTGGELLNNAEIKAKFDEIINEYCPNVLRREELEDNGNLKYIFTLNFNSRADYISKVSKITEKQIQAWLVKPNSALAKGWRFTEDFNTSELFQWIKRGAEEKDFNDLKINLNCISNIINMNGDIQSSGAEKTEVNSVTGKAVTGVYIETVNNKLDSYDRRLTLSVPQSTYDEMGSELIKLMESRTLSSAAYSGWSQQGNNQEYQILYNGLSLAELQKATAMFLDCDTVSLYYGDQNNSSTPLAEQLVFEENINALSFVPKDKSKVEFSYKYSLPLKTTHGEGVLLRDGIWEKEGEWIDGIYSLKSTDSVYDIRIPDGIQYEIKGINVTLESYDNDNYVRSFDFVYSAANGEEGRDYAYDFLAEKGVNVERTKSDEGVICRITSRGTAKQISAEINSVFGGGNMMTYTQKTDNMSVVTDISFTDQINISYMLTGKNKAAPLIYTLYSKGNESVSGFSGTSADGSGDSSGLDINKSKGYVLELEGGESTVKYTATMPYPQGVAIYCAISGVMILITALLILHFMKKSRKIEERKAQELARQAEAQSRYDYDEQQDKKALPEEHYDERFNRF